VKALGGGIAIQHRMVYQGEDFLKRYGKEMTAEAPPIRRILAAGVPMGAGTDATRVASYNPWVSLAWLVTGSTLGGTILYPKENRVDRTTALRLWTEANAWFSREEGKKGAIRVGQLAEVAVVTADYMTVPDTEIRHLASVLTLVGGNVVYGEGPFATLASPLPPASPDWSPVNRYGGYHRPVRARAAGEAALAGAMIDQHNCTVHGQRPAFAWLAEIPAADQREFWSALGCGCWMG
jgi:hypothetical protein